MNKTEKADKVDMTNASKSNPVASMYEALTPSNDIKNGEEYIAALDWALAQEDIYNIAISGPYGSGKSSVINTYLKRRARKDVLAISLAAFNLEKMIDGEDVQIDTEILENGILKQLFYSVSADKIPDSRFRKLQPEKLFWNMINGTINEILLIAILYIFVPERLNALVTKIDELCLPLKVLAIVGIIAGLWGACLNVTRWFSKHGIVKEINILDKAKVTSESSGHESIFDKNMDEIIYFFEKTKIRIVVIEDLDRFESTNIFVALRELNNLLNHYENIKEKITFIYAIKDDMFAKEGERTKFFDFIIPVVPYISSTNSGEVLRCKLRFDDKSDKSGICDISGKYVSLLSPYIKDMRDLTCICNEFFIFKNTLKGNQQINLSDEQMFSLITFKNLYPKDFAELEDESENSIVRQAFFDKRNIILNKEDLLNKKRQSQEDLIKKCDQESLYSIRDLKIALLTCVLGYKASCAEMIFENREYQLEELLRDDFDFDRLKKKRIEIYEDDRYRRSQSINDIEKKVKENGGDYFERIERVKQGIGKCKEEAKRVIEQYEQRLNELRTYSLSKIIEEFGTDFLSKSVRNNDLLVFLLRNGFINENYVDYINYFHPNSITKEEMNFILGVRNHRSDADYTEPLNNVSQIFDRLQDYEFKQKEALNIDLADYILEKKASTGSAKFLFEQLADHSVESMSFIKAYIESGKYVERFVRMLCKENHLFWKDISSDTGIPIETRAKFLAYIIANASVEDIKTLDEKGSQDSLSQFMESYPDILLWLSSVSSEKQIQVIEALELRFSELNIEGVEESVIQFVFDRCCYKLNAQMIHKVVTWRNPVFAEELAKRNYSTIQKLGYQKLEDYINENFVDYISEIVVGEATNTEEDIEVVEGILEKLYPDNLELSLAVLDHEIVVWDKLDSCCERLVNNAEELKYKKEVWTFLLQRQKVQATWDNVYAYFNMFGSNITWATFIDQGIEDLLLNDNKQVIEDKVLEEMLLSSISDDTFQKIIRCFAVKDFAGDLGRLNVQKIIMLIEEFALPFNVATWTHLFNYVPKVLILFAEHYREEFMTHLDEIKLDECIIDELLMSTVFEDKEKSEILQKLNMGMMTTKTAKIIRSSTIKVSKAYVDTAWNLLIEDERNQLLLNHMGEYSNDELPALFSQLSKEYNQLVERTRHKFTLGYTDYNRQLLEKLKERDYITSFDEGWIGKEHVFTGNVKQSR